MIRIGSIYSIRAHRASAHHPSCPARDGSGPCVGCGTPQAPMVPAPRPSSAWLDDVDERTRRYHSSTAVGR